MKKLLPLILLVGCADSYRVMLCRKDGVGCEPGYSDFPTKEECEDFARKADQVQPSVQRICVKVNG